MKNPRNSWKFPGGEVLLGYGLGWVTVWIGRRCYHLWRGRSK